MRSIAYYFMLLSVISAIAGMAWGIQMSASQDHLLSPAHGHLNLIGWVSFAIFALYYHAVPKAAEGILPKAHLGLGVATVLIMVPGIVMAITESGETLAKLGSALGVLMMIVFLVVVAKNRS